MTRTLIQKQKIQTQTIRSLIRETSSGEDALRERITNSRNSAERKRTADLQSCEDKYASARDQAKDKKEKVVEDVDQRRTLEPIVLKEKHEEHVNVIKTRAEDLIERTETKLNEAIWLAESVFEGAVSKPREKASEAREELSETQEVLDELCEEAPKALSRLRQSQESNADGGTAEDTKSMADYVAGARNALEAIKSDPKARWFVGIKPAVIVFIVTVAATFTSGTYYGWAPSIPLFVIPIGAMCISILSLRVTFVSGRNSVRNKLSEFVHNVSSARKSYSSSLESIEAKRRAKEKKLISTRDSEIKKAEDKYKPRLAEVERLYKKDIDKEKTRFKTVAKKLTAKLQQDLDDSEITFRTSMTQIDNDEKEENKRIESTYKKTIKSINEDEKSTRDELVNRWDKELTSFRTDVDEQNASNNLDHPSWDTKWSKWEPCTVAFRHIPVGKFIVDFSKIAGDLPSGSAYKLHGSEELALPICSSLPSDASLLISSSGKNRVKSIRFLQNAMLRVLTSIPPGKAKFTLLDPIGLGQSFAGVLHLADYEESQLLDRAWTEPKHIETQLARLTEHMETVIQKYLRNEFESIDAYNEQAGEIAEPYRFLVIADLPNNFSDNAAKRLSSIITSGERCGVHVIIHRDSSIALPNGIDDDTLKRIPIRFVEDDGTFKIDSEELSDLPLLLEDPPDENTTTIIVKRVGDTAEDTHRVEVPFSVIAPKKDSFWSKNTSQKIVVPLGRSGATKMQNLTLGRGTAQHALIAGKTGSGKSTLLHVLITNLALWYRPEEIEFYLVDFKKGVEFKTYATNKLPHARVVAVESDREFGISVLQKIDSELKRRGELFRELGVQDIAGFREKCQDPMPRILLIIDEFQEFFIDDDKVAQEANLLLDRLVRQGRAFGIHAIMGSQTLDGAYTLSRSTMGQMAVRIALQCSEQDSYIILNEDNAAARLLSRPGEAIYNDAAGNVEGNSPFQVVWLDDNEREVLLENLNQRDNGQKREMVVYEGNKPLHLQSNSAYQSTKESVKPVSVKAWLGGAMAIKEDTSATFRQATGSNLLIVGQQDETTSGMIANSLLSLDKQLTPNEDESVKFILLDGTPADSTHAPLLPNVAKSMRNTVNKIGTREIVDAMSKVNEELQIRLENGSENSPTMFFVINALHRFRSLRRDEDDYGFSMGDEDKPKTPAQIFAELLKEGSTLGMHVIISTDTLANLNRSFDRQTLREFDIRVLLQMGANDSTNLIDTPEASRLGMHRALLYSEESGTIEPFRPYAPP
jgi:ABC-type multidrug transport system fused ATPase/permease subunit